MSVNRGIAETVLMVVFCSQHHVWRPN